MLCPFVFVRLQLDRSSCHRSRDLNKGKPRHYHLPAAISPSTQEAFSPTQTTGLYKLWMAGSTYTSPPSPSWHYKSNFISLWITTPCVCVWVNIHKNKRKGFWFSPYFRTLYRFMEFQLFLLIWLLKYPTNEVIIMLYKQYNGGILRRFS